MNDVKKSHGTTCHGVRYAIQRGRLERYYTHIRHGRKPSEEMLADLRERYEAIGGFLRLRPLRNNRRKSLLNG